MGGNSAYGQKLASKHGTDFAKQSLLDRYKTKPMTPPLPKNKMLEEELEAKAALLDAHKHTTICNNEDEENIWEIAYIMGRRSGASLAIQGTKWIPVTERKPEIGEDVLVIVGTDTVLKGRLMNNGWTAFYSDGEQLVGVTRPVKSWMPLPSPPSE